MRELLIYKPRPKGGGVAMKLNFRPSAQVEGDDSAAGKGGLFAELAPQLGVPAAGAFASFGWAADTKGRVVSKLGLPDISGFLVAYQQLRVIQGMLAFEKRTLPGAMQSAKAKDPKTTLSLFHKFGSGSTVISWQFTADGSYLGISKSATDRGSISLTLPEELLVVRYLDFALQQFLLRGMR